MTALIMIAVIITSILIGAVVGASDTYFLFAGWTPVIIVIIHMIILTYKGKI